MDFFRLRSSGRVHSAGGGGGQRLHGRADQLVQRQDLPQQLRVLPHLRRADNSTYFTY